MSDMSDLNIKELRVRITYAEPLLGTASANKELHSEFIASKAPDAPSREEEVAAIGVDAVEEKAMTVFPRTDDGVPFTWDYQWKGFFKESCGMLRRAPGFRSKKLSAYKKVIDGLIFILPRKVILELPKGGMIGELQRPLRASTAQGERIALAHSELVPAGTTQEFTIRLLDAGLEPLVREWMAYGQLHGTGQWRNASFGRFDTEWL
jgi:hypothetical protein